jgi:hypothetical protein
MLFVAYLEVNDNIGPDERREMAQRLTLHGELPPTGIDVVRWASSPEGRTVAIIEACDEPDVRHALAGWGAAAPGFLRHIAVEPAHPALDAIHNGDGQSDRRRGVPEPPVVGSGVQRALGKEVRSGPRTLSLAQEESWRAETSQRR